MSNYDLLKQKIQEAIPRLMKLEKGTVFSSATGGLYEYVSDLGTLKFTAITKINSHLTPVTIEKRHFKYGSSYKMIGKEPMLNDVLEWLKILSQEMYGETDLRLYNHFVIHYLGTWDLSSPYLKDQNIVMSDRLIVLYDGVS